MGTRPPLTVTSKLPGPAWDVSTKNVTDFPTVPLLTFLTLIAPTSYTLAAYGLPAVA